MNPVIAPLDQLIDEVDREARMQETALYLLSAYSLGIEAAPTPAQAGAVIRYFSALRAALDAAAAPTRAAWAAGGAP